jgi:ABC-type multidrug transport system fused ATPase/permease subunit
MGYMRGVLAVSGGGVEILTTQETLTPPTTSSSSSSSSVAAQTIMPLDSLVTDHRSGSPTGSQVSVSVPLAHQPATPSSIEFRHVSFHYSPRTYHSSGSSPTIDEMDSSFKEGSTPSGQSISLLKNVSFSILPGENVAIVGPSGSGE